jgi:hypothetical protein
MKVTVKIEGIDEALAAVDPKICKKALAKTVRRMGQKFKAVATKEVRKTYNIKAKRLKERIKTRTATSDNGFVWTLKVDGRQTGLVGFGARQVKKGVSVRVRKDRGRKVIKGAFIAPGKSGNVHVFRRVDGKRLPIEAKKTLSVPQMFNDKIVEKAKKEVAESFSDELKHHLDYYLGKIR